MFKKLVHIILISLQLSMFCTSAFAVSTATCNDTDTVTMLHYEGQADGATTFTDTSTCVGGCPHTYTALNQAQIDTAQFKFGAASVLFDGAADNISTPDSTDFDFGTGNFTVETWVRFNSVAASQELVSVGNGSNGVEMFFNGGTTLFCRINGGAVDVSTAWSPATNTWYHVACIRSGTTLASYIDGVQQGTNTSSNNIDTSTGVTIGTDTGQSRAVNGWEDETRIVKGTAIWTTSFTPPTAAYSDTCVTRRRVRSTVMD